MSDVFLLACLLAIVCGVMLGAASRLWNMPAERPIRIGDRIVVRKSTAHGSFQVVATCECDGAKQSAYGIYNGFGRLVWFRHNEIERAP